VLTLVVGRSSNLSTRLASSLGECILVSARGLTPASLAALIPPDDYRVVINSFQPSARLGDLSDPVAFVDLSLGVTARVLEAVAGTRCVKLVYTSSASVYGNNVSCAEDAPCQAGDLHSGLKVANENLVRGFCTEQGIDATVARLFNMYGGEDNFSVVAKVVAAVMTGSVLPVANDGNAVRDFVHIDDVVETYRKLLQTTALPVVNVASGVGVSVRTIVDAIRFHGYPLETVSRARAEIRVSTADVTLLSRLVDVGSFTHVVDHVLAELRDRTRMF
jgi:UDP-glucose 4-epimerase